MRFLWRRVGKLLRLAAPVESGLFLLRWLLRRPLIPLRLRGLQTDLLVRRIDSDITVLWQVFGDRECDVDLSEPPRLIVDGGAYVGYSTVYFATRYPEARVVAVEPATENYELLVRNCRSYDNVEIVRAGLWSSNAALQISNPGVKSWGFRVSETSAEGNESIHGVTIPQLLARYGQRSIDILKLDIEGAEEKLFSEGADEWLPRVRAIVIEIHGPRCGEAVREAVRRHGFTEFQQGEKIVFTRPAAAPTLLEVKAD